MSATPWKALFGEILPGQGYEVCLNPPASLTVINCANTRFATTLPNSYCSWLKYSNGVSIRRKHESVLFPVDRLELLNVAEPALVDAYVTAYRAGPPLSDASYRVYGKEQVPEIFPVLHLKCALLIGTSSREAWYLLNPSLVTIDGEWEAWFFANWLPGAIRYPSFQEMMEHEFINRKTG